MPVLMVLMGYMLQGAAGFSYLMWGGQACWAFFSSTFRRAHLPGDSGVFLGSVAWSLLNYQKSTIVAALVAPLLSWRCRSWIPVAITRRGLRDSHLPSGPTSIHHYLIRMVCPAGGDLCFYGLTVFLVLAFVLVPVAI
jgi:hypothetical protein